MKTIRVVTWNIHKGVNGLRPRRRLEIHNIGLAIDQFDADIVCLQEVRKHHHGDAQKFPRWPALEQANFLAPLGYTPVYQTNAITKHGEHGNALLTRWPVIKHQHEDMSDHRFEQRGLLHVELLIHNQPVHVVVVHLGLIKSSRRRQIMQLCTYLQREIPKNVPLLVAGDFNDWGSSCETALKSEQLRTYKTNPITSKKLRTYPSRLPLIQFDYVFARQLDAVNCIVPNGVHWARMSDHLPLIADFKTSD